MSSVKCAVCEKRIAEAEATILDIELSTRGCLTGVRGTFRHGGVILCPFCTKQVEPRLIELEQVVKDAVLGKVLSFSCRLPKIGDVLYEVVPGHPVVELLVTRFENGYYDAAAKEPTEAGTVTFSVFEFSSLLDKKLFYSKRKAQIQRNKIEAEID